MKETISPNVDIAFKKIFGVDENKDLLISLINSIVSQEDQVSDVTILNPYNPRNFKNEKLSILDIKAEGNNGRKFNIEIQIADEADYDKRALYYWAKLYTQQLLVSNDYSSLSKAIGIHILNFTSIPKVKEYHNVFHITEKTSSLQYFKDLELHTIELKKFISNAEKNLSDLVSKVKNKLDMWVAFLTRHELLKANTLPSPLNDANLKKAINVLDVMNFTSEERALYEDHLKWLRMEVSALEKVSADSRAIGRAEGRAEGLEEGAAKAKKDLALKMLANGFSIETITELTTLSVKEIDSFNKK